MKTWILSSDSQISSTKRLIQALKKSKFETEVLNPHELQIEFGHRGLSVFHFGEKCELPDLILPRLGWATLDHGLRLLRLFEAAGVRVVNSATSFCLATDKLTSLQIFHQNQLPIPQTRFAHATAESEWHLFPRREKHVFKTLQGSQGFGVIWQDSRQQSRAQVDAFRTLRAPALVQEMIEESFGEDIRAFVIDGTVVAAMKRQAPQNEMRSNLHQKGKAKPTKLNSAETELALRACAAMGLFYAGIDLMRTKKGPLLLEANPCPGLDGISEVSGLDMASKLIQSILRSS